MAFVLPCGFTGILKPDLPVGALDLIRHIAAQGAAVLHSVAEVCSDGAGHDALLHRALEQEAVGAIGTVRHDPAQRRCQRVGEVLACILRAEIAHVEVQRLLNELAAAFTVGLLQPAVHAADRRGSEPSGDPRLILMFHIVFSFFLV